MSTHEIPLSIVLQMQEMDGSPQDSAELVLDLYIDDIRKAIEDVTGHTISHIEVEEPDNSNPDIEEIVVQCVGCKRTFVLHVTRTGFQRWRYEGVLIQQAMPDLTADERELLMTSTCGDCFDKLFAD